MTVHQSVEKGTVYRQWVVSLIGATSIFTYGLQSGWMSPSILILQSEDSPSGYSLSNYEISWIASSISIFGLISAPLYGYSADVLGRKISLILIAIPQILGFALKLISAHPICLVVSQACCGIAGGGVFCVPPIYIKEISQGSLRGILSSSGIFLQALGIFLMYIMGAYLDYSTVLWIVVWIPIINVIVLMKAPESPAYLVKKGRIEEATEITAWMRGVDINDKEVEQDVQVTKNEMEKYENLPPVSFKSIMACKSSRRALGISFLLISMLDLGGNYAILTFASVIIRNAGVTFAPDLQSLSFPAVMALGSLVPAMTIERIGRKPIIICSVILTGLPMGLLATMILVQEKANITLPWLAVVCIGVCLFATGMNMAMPFVVIAEMFSIQLRSKVLGIIVTYGWSVCFIQTFIFTPVTEYFGMYTMFYGFAAIDLIGVVICYVIMPETKGKSAEEISKELEGLKS